MSNVFASCSAFRLLCCSIDTPGVIQRVSRLFHGNPNLIQGFNTFLPVGYRIDISSDPLDPNTITVTTPLGTTIQSINNAYGRLPLGYGAPMGSGTLSRSMTPHPLHLHAASPFDPSGFSSTQTTAAASFLGNLNGRDPVGKQAAGEFNHAIQYLNKIKARYVDDNNTYKQFLDILQTYQKEQRDIQDVSITVTCSSIIITLRRHVRSIFKYTFYSRIRPSYWQNSRTFFQKPPQLFLARTVLSFCPNKVFIWALPLVGVSKMCRFRVLPCPKSPLLPRSGGSALPRKTLPLHLQTSCRRIGYVTPTIMYSKC